MDTKKYLRNMLSVSGLVAMATAGHAVTINVDGINHATLSSAVAAAYQTDDGPDIINITTNTLSLADPNQIILDKPIVINGDAENTGAGDGVPCDILVDMGGIRDAADAGLPYKSYIEVQVAGSVDINNIRIRPNANGSYAAIANEIANNVSGIRVHLPAGSGELGNYTFTKVAVTAARGAANNYVAMDDGADLFANNTKKWAGLNGSNDLNIAKHAAFHLSSEAGGLGSVKLVLDHCHIGLSRGCGLSVNGPVSEPARVDLEIKGGVYGHTARDAIRIANATAKIQGTQNDRVRVLRAANIAADNSHSIEIIDSIVPIIEYVDSAGCNTANGFSIRGAATNVTEIAYCRGMGRFLQPAENITNEQLYMTGNSRVDLIRDCTFHGLGANPNPVHINSAGLPLIFRDCIFTSDNSGTVRVSAAEPNIVTLTNCALPTDLVTSETLANPPLSGAGIPVVVSPVSVSPLYQLTLSGYDWSDAQGVGNPSNGAGNKNVLRPSNSAYNSASSTLGTLTGGAGPDSTAGIEEAVWMLM